MENAEFVVAGGSGQADVKAPSTISRFVHSSLFLELSI
jgi:hypothetical protein